MYSSSSGAAAVGKGGRGAGLLQARTCFFQLLVPMLSDDEDMAAAVEMSLANMGAFIDE